MKDALTWTNLPPRLRKMISAADLAQAPRVGGPLPQVAPDAPPRNPPDGWRARLEAAGKPPRHPPGYSEHKMQSELVAWSQGEIAAGRLALLGFLFAVPNQRQCSPAAGRWMRAEGLKPGVPDLFLPVPRAGFCGAVVEMKCAPNKPTPEQAAWLDGLEAIGHRCAVCYDLETAKTFLASYLSPAKVTPLL